MMISKLTPEEYSNLVVFLNETMDNFGDHVYRQSLIGYDCIAIKENNNIISALVYGKINGLNKDGILMLGTKKEHRCKNYATSLINEYIKITSNSISEHYLLCRKKNNIANNLYLKLGWTLCNTINDYYWNSLDDANVYKYVETSTVL
jgi:ribosomal protein S18 acetylase RimI-like enzyme